MLLINLFVKTKILKKINLKKIYEFFIYISTFNNEIQQIKKLD